MKVGILGCGGIATKMAKAMNSVEGVVCYAVGSRTKEKAEEFAKSYGFEKAYGSYEELAGDSDLDLIYIATPHSHHYEHSMLCLERGRNILVEKAFCITPKQAERVLSLAKRKGLFAGEAMWTRFMPSRSILNSIIEREEAGRVCSITASLGYPLMDKERLTEPSLGGGAMLDLGVYPINFAMMVSRSEIKKISAMGVLSEKKIDLCETMHMEFESGVVATLHATMQGATDRRGMICCTEGYVEVENINNPEWIGVYDREHRLVRRYDVPEQVNGYEYELAAAVRAIEEGRIETEEMPHSETMRVMRCMDRMLREMGVVHTG